MTKACLNDTKPDLLCNHSFSAYPSDMKNEPENSLKSRLKIAIEKSPPSQTAIAEFCDVTVQSVGGWKKTGRISTDNLKKLSQITGYRYLWLLNGEPPETFTTPTQNLIEIQISEHTDEYNLSEESPAATRLVESLKYALANKRINDTSIEMLTTFINSLVDNQND